MTDIQKVLETKIETYDLEYEPTLREYFRELLTELWIEGEGFSGKRPLGNSSWQFDVYGSLMKAGHLDGKFDEDGYIEEVDYEQGNALILECIKSL